MIDNDTPITKATELCIEYALSTRSDRTAATYKNALRAFAEFLDVKPPTPLSQINMTHFIRFPAWLAKMKYSKKTCNVYMSGAKFFLDYLVINGIMRPNYEEQLRWEKAVSMVHRKREERLPRFPEKEDVSRMLRAARQSSMPEVVKARNIALVEFLASSGCRNDEAATLAIENMDLKGRNAIVTGKGNKERRIFFSTVAAESFEQYFSLRGFRDLKHPVFARHDKGIGKRISFVTNKTITNIVEHIAILAGIEPGKFTPHYFRHAFAIKMLRESGNLALVQDLLGHASPTATRVYAKIYPDDLEEAYHKVFG